MKRLILCIIVTMNPIISWSQNNTFDITFNDFADIAAGQQVEVLQGGSLLIAGSTYNTSTTESPFFLANIDTNGNMLWGNIYENTFAYSDDYNKISPIAIVQGETDKIAAVYSKAVGDSFCVSFAKFSLDGEVLLEKIITEIKQGFGIDIEIIDDGNFLLSYFYINGLSALVKIDSEGEVIWEKYFHNNTHPLMDCIDNNTFLFSDNKRLIKYNSAGDSLDSVILDSVFDITSIDVTESGILVSTLGGYFYKIDENLNVLWSNRITNSTRIMKIIHDNVGGYLINCISGSNTDIIKISFDGSIQWQTDIRGQTFSLKQLANSNIVLTGELNEELYFAKTDSDGMIYQIELLKPTAGQVLKSFNTFNIKWYSSSINTLNIELSSDGGENWELIEANVNATDQQYNWNVPILFSNNCFIKLSSVEYPEVFGMNSEPFTITTYKENDYIAANEVKMWIRNNGSGSHNPLTDGAGFLWPGGENATLPGVFYDGLVFGGKYDGEIRVNGSTYRSGLRPGMILETGEPDDPNNPLYSVFKLNKYWELFPPGTEKDIFEYNHDNWPVIAGAPFIDNNNDGVYDPEIDSPRYLGDETLFSVANDKDTTYSEFAYGSEPMGIEFQTLVWAFSSIPGLDDVVYKKYTIINKSNTVIEDMYLTYWADCDLGIWDDDFAGCDTNLNLGYIYNADENDDGYYGYSPPAVGHMLLQGPIVQGEPTDTAVFKEKILVGYKNLPMTSFVFYDALSTYSILPEEGNYQGTLEFYNNMHGKKSSGEPFINPNTDEETIFPLSGNPEEGIGWYEGAGWSGGLSKGDRIYAMSSGPFNFAPGDTQEVVYAIFMAEGSDNLNSVTELKSKGEYIHQYFDDVLADVTKDNEVVISEYKLYQNYPNPFNPTTIIEFTIPTVERDLSRSNRSELKSALQTKLIIYDVLGREVKTLINKPMQPGKHKVEFSASDLASGVYFYQLKAGDYIDTKKMILLR
ncbi:MAG: T9SS type A sorting domain-containing protein [Melioribacteraceae bacterium]|nr:T9SS type A sorting domain-containing protein [Melioribacteraceae bacterium]MCF8353357.1 T9SS type A sorting domain-containing protein [Melioribacteraceae bacterium]MCF8393221.1 T9SS type A sorting domain-containing protein [Melioribacteraceae bacterium]MCF8419083.1 T9SS type A sorting domain-containing protein [Melioribacteraceae bacterium]